MPIARLFSAIFELNFDGLEANTPQQQAWWAGLARQVVNQEVEAKRRTLHNACDQGSLSLRELTCILSAALLDCERIQRRLDFQRERQAKLEAGFTLKEVEDLRELYNTYMGIVVANNNPFARLLKLFECCGIKGFSTSDVTTLRNVVKQTSQDWTGPVRFDMFLRWMSIVFQHRMGGMGRQSRRSSTVTPSASRRPSDASYVASEAPYEEGVTGFVAAVERERKRLAGTSVATTRVVSKDKCALPRIPRQASKASTHGSKTRSRIVSRAASRSGSRSNSIGSATSVMAAEKASKIFSLKGLPPTEAMLARKKFRANSMDISAQTQDSDVEKRDLGELEKSSQQQIDLTDMVLSRMRNDLGSEVGAGPKDGRQQAGMREEKPVMDCKQVVSGAISKLSTLLDES
jgi:hypothetical protein